MEDRKINEVESLELISDMIRKTKKEASLKQDYNQLLLYGYSAVALSVLVWFLIYFTENWSYKLV